MDIAALLAAMQKPLLDDEVTEENSSELSSLLSSMVGLGALPEMEDDEPLEVADSNATRQKRFRQNVKKRKIEKIAVLDFETDPFDNGSDASVYPFLCVLYFQDRDHIVIWDDDFESLILKVITAIEALDDEYTFYAHNGGRFDYKFMLPWLRGEIKFKGSSIMKAQIGKHELRDSLHILPTNLASLKKDAFDYAKMHKDVRWKHRDEIIEYCINDCKYALEFIVFFIQRNGFKISIGQAAFAQVKQLYPMIENLGPAQDALFRQFFFGGRVECFEGIVHVKQELVYIDLNSAYPAVMAYVKHPIGKTWIEGRKISPDTFFVDVSCHSKGALILREKIDGDVKTLAPHGYYRFHTTIHEYKAALDLGLISDITIHQTYDCPLSTTFADFIIPRYNDRKKITAHMKTLMEGTSEWSHCNKEQTVIKFELNNAYGKFAQNPARYKENMITAPTPENEKELLKDGWQIDEMGENHWLWWRRNEEFRYNNVATGASITGAQRAVLLRALHSVERPLYCDTDSIICASTGILELDETKLGAWKQESTLAELIVNGKKLYAYRDKKKDKWTIRSKGASGLTLENMLAINQGEKIYTKQKGVTLYNDGTQRYTGRTVRATGVSERIRADAITSRSRNSLVDADIS